MSRNVIPQADADGDGVFSAITSGNPLDFRLAVAPEPNALFDGYGRLRISAPVTVWDGSFVAANNGTLRWHAQVTGSGAVDTATNPRATLTTSGAGLAIFQSRRVVTYQPAKSTTVFISGTLCTSAPTAGGTNAYFGYARAPAGVSVPTSGVVFLRRSTGMKVAITRDTGTTIVNQAEWNVDTLDGNGPSGLTIDFNFRQIYYVSFKWLGSGDVELGVIVGQQMRPAHVFSHTNALSPYAYWPSGSQRIYAALSTPATEGALEMVLTCASAISDGGYTAVGHMFAVTRSAPATVTVGVPTVVYSLRIDPANIHTTVRITSVTSHTTFAAGTDVRVEIWHILSPQSEGSGSGLVDQTSAAGWNAVGSSLVQTSEAVIPNAVTNGTADRRVALDYTSRDVKGAVAPDNLLVNVDPLGASDIVYVVATAAGGTGTGPIDVAITYEEFN